MNTRSNNRPRHLAVTLALASAAVCSTIVAAPAAHADEVIAADTSLSSPVAAAHIPTARASKPRQVVVTNHGGRSVVLFAKGERIRRILAPGNRPATFTGLTPGRTYTVAVGGEPIGTVIALDAPSAASGLTVRSTSAPGAVALAWRHSPTVGTGGRLIAYDLSARSSTAPTITSSVVGSRQATLTGLDPRAIYTFSVVPRNSAGHGRGTTAVMSRPLGGSATSPAKDEPAITTVAATPLPAPAPVSPQPAPAPAPAPTPATRTVYRCPAGYTENVGALCEKSLTYTFTYLPYTFHSEVTGPAPLLDSYETASSGCPSGYSLEDYGWIKYCRRYGAAPTIQVKDAPPAGYTDDGTQWMTKDAAPTGYIDDGSRWVSLVPKEAVTVPA